VPAAPFDQLVTRDQTGLVAWHQASGRSFIISGLANYEDGLALVVEHPIFTLNSIFPSLGVWTQQRLMYQLTPLGQDVPYRLPTSIWPCVLLHGVIGLCLLLPEVAEGDAPSDR
jgi:hypothetical protein